MDDLETVQTVIGKRLANDVHGMQEQAHERDVDVFVERFRVGRVISSLLDLFVRTLCDVAQYADAVFSSLSRAAPSRRFTSTASVTSWSTSILSPLSHTTSNGVVASLIFFHVAVFGEHALPMATASLAFCAGA